MTDIIERELNELRGRLGSRGIERLRDLILNDANTWAIEAELGVPKLVSKLLAGNLSVFLRATEKSGELRLVYSRVA